MKYITTLIITLIFFTPSLAQHSLRVTVKDSTKAKPISNVAIKIDEYLLAATDSVGICTLSLAYGSYHFSAEAIGYATRQFDVVFTATTTNHTVLLQPGTSELEEVVLIASSRSNQAIETSPLKVEVLGSTELSEEASIKPGNIASILGDVSGVQIQQSSAVSGNSNVRIQGLPGRYTQIVRDGMPMFDGFSGGMGILTIPPLDLRQIELIKGSASTLYGGGAIGGLINLTSKRPTLDQQMDLLANYSTLTEANINGYAARRYRKLGYTLFVGHTNQLAVDVNKDGFSDVPKLSSTLIHPRLYFYPNDKTIAFIDYSGSIDRRRGGDMTAIDNKGGTNTPFFEDNQSNRHSFSAAIDHYYSGGRKLTAKALVSQFTRTIDGNFKAFTARQISYYSEVAWSKAWAQNNLVLGTNLCGDDYSNPDVMPWALSRFQNQTVGAFGQYVAKLKTNTTVQAGMRIDHHFTFGTFALPDVRVFQQLNEHWGARVGFGMGYKTPNPLNQQDVDVNPTTVAKTITATAEKSYAGNAEVNYKKEWGDVHLFVNQAFYLTSITNPVYFSTVSGALTMGNAPKPVTTKGSDTYVKLDWEHWELYAGYTYTDARLTYLSKDAFIPLTPRNRWAFVLVKEIRETWRIGLEGSAIGKQYRYDGTPTPSYFFMAMMVQRNVGKHISIVLNGENLLDYRMSNAESLYTGPRAFPTFKPLWAPIDGRVINCSVRWKM
jgi:outer membrane receptor for ferrienterochelin and colicins